MARSTVHYHDNGTNKILKSLHNKLRPAGTPIERVEYIIELLLLRIFEVKLKQDDAFKPLRRLFEGEDYRLLFSYLKGLTGEQALAELNKNIFPFYANILTHARKVIKGNLPTKIQDHLVLTEEVFANSSFTNNVKGGLMGEVISLVSELDEQVVLKTDLLGDAIESALSETGGTKDIGLYRTPEHIRKMMVAMVDPDFADIIHDPACGTGGFLFDTYEYIIGKAENSDQWPSDDIIEHFYRGGLSGVEYQGRIRKMAAVNMYIRGLNPHNIEQGDSLKLYDPSIHKESCSVVIANPPFGAECDQPAYPNVWEEYSREKETTILFVKLMLELLKKGGRCAVVVSEGFLTWGQNSACRLRQMLLQETNLKAIISLPQGVFVSKNGQGPKTSILYFEKGTPTDFIWYYKIENDGFSMGTNRQPIEGSQMPELLEIWKSVKQGIKPEDSRHRFCIPRRWIETLDPRVKERIRKDTREKLILKDKAKREKFVVKVKQDLEKKKISKEIFDEKLSQYDELFEVQVQNTIAKEIEKTHTHHFNLQNYRSSLTDEQIKKWQEVFNISSVHVGESFPSVPSPLAGEGQGEGEVSLDERYNRLIPPLENGSSKIPPLKKGDTGGFYDKALKVFSAFNPSNALEMDIAREFLHKLSEETLKDDEKLKTLEELIRRGFQYPLVLLRELIKPKYEKIKKDDYKGDLDIVDKISFSDGKIHLREQRQTGMDLYIAEAGELITSKINLHQGAVAINDIGKLACSTHYQVYHVNQSEATPEYLALMFRSNKFLENIASEKNKGIKNESGYEFISGFSIPLPPLETQREIVAKIEKQKTIIEAAKRIEESWDVPFDIFKDFPKVHISEFAELNPLRNYLGLDDNSLVSFVPMEAIDEFSGTIKIITEKPLKDVKKGYTFFAENDVLFAKITPCMENGKTAIARNLSNGIGFGTTELHVFRAKTSKAVSEYIYYLLRTKYFRKKAAEYMTGASGHKRVPEKFLLDFPYPLPPLPIQQEVVAKFDKEMEALEGVRLLRQEAERRIEKMIVEVWGESS